MDYAEKLEILLSAGLEVPPAGAPGPSAEQLAAKIIADNEVRTIAMDLAIDAFVATAVRGMSEARRLILRKRIGGLPVAPAPAMKVTWGLFRSVIGSGMVAIQGQTHNEQMNFTGTPEAARQWTWKNSKPPEEIIEAYAKEYVPRPALPVEFYKAAATPKEKSRLQVLAEAQAVKLVEVE